MNAHRPSRLRPTWLVALAAMAVSTSALAQATKTATTTVKVQEKAKEKPKAADAIDVNSASTAELMELPGVGEATAKKIIDGRPYKTLDDLSTAGVNAATLAKIKPLAVARPLPTAVDVNTATAAQLETLPGVGPALAKAIVEARPYAKFDDLGRVKGLGVAKLEALRGRVSFAKATIEEKVKAKADAAKKEIKTKADEVKAKIETGKEEMKAKAEVVKEKAEMKAEAAKEKAGEVKDKVVKKAGEVKDTVEKKAGEMKDKVEKKAGEVKDEVKKKVETAKGKIPSGKKININTATADELDELFGIGPARAKLIIDNRPYTKIEDIMKVKGIKEVEFEKIKDQITVD